MAFGLGVLKLTPAAFWGMTLKELAAVVRGIASAGAGMSSTRSVSRADASDTRTDLPVECRDRRAWCGKPASKSAHSVPLLRPPREGEGRSNFINDGHPISKNRGAGGAVQGAAAGSAGACRRLWAGDDDGVPPLRRRRQEARRRAEVGGAEPVEPRAEPGARADRAGDRQRAHGAARQPVWRVGVRQRWRARDAA